MCTTVCSCLMCLNVPVFPLCLLRTSTQPSPASYLRRKSRSCSTSCTRPMGWSPTHRDLSLEPAWSRALHECLTVLCASGSTGRGCPESISSPGSPVLILTVLIRIRLSHTPTCTPQLSPECISSFLSCCCASRLDLPAALTPFSICWCFCTANTNRRTSSMFPPPSFPVLPVLSH